MIDHLFKQTMKLLLLAVGITGFSVAWTPCAEALEHWHLPIEKELKTLKVQNRDSQAHTLWISGPIEILQEPLETSFQIPAFGSLEIPLNQFSDKPWIHIKTQDSGTFQMQILTSSESAFILNPGPSLRWKGYSRPQSQVVLLNLAPFTQTIKILGGKEPQSLQLPAFGKIRLPLDSLGAGNQLSFEGEAHLAGVLLAAQNSKSLNPDPTPTALMTVSDQTTHYFRLSNKSNSQGYVVSLSDPELVGQAQAQVSNPTKALPRILIGEIDFGNGGVNRDFSDPRKTPWSWQVHRVIKFTELASQECDGSPDMLEEFLKPWKENSATICFWNYHISEELTLDQVRLGRGSTPPGPASLPRALQFESHHMF